MGFGVVSVLPSGVLCVADFLQKCTVGPGRCLSPVNVLPASWGPEFHYVVTHGGRKESTSFSCPLTSTCYIMAHGCEGVHTHAQRRLDVQNCNDDIKDFCGPAWEVINSSGIVFGKASWLGAGLCVHSSSLQGFCLTWICTGFVHAVTVSVSL